MVGAAEYGNAPGDRNGMLSLRMTIAIVTNVTTNAVTAASATTCRVSMCRKCTPESQASQKPSFRCNSMELFVFFRIDRRTLHPKRKLLGIESERDGVVQSVKVVQRRIKALCP